DNVTGLGYQSGPPMVPSVETSPAAPTVSQLDQIVTDLTNRPGVVRVDDKSFSGTKIFGTELVPQITYLTATGDVTIKGNGSVGGGGALPAPLTVTSLADCAQLPAAVGGCP